MKSSFLTGKDKILKPFYNLHYNNGLIKSLERIYKKIFRKMDSATFNQKNKLLKFLYKVVVWLIYAVISIAFIPLYLVIYLVTALITFSLETVLIVALAIFYGVFPFVLGCNVDKEGKVKYQSKYKGIDSLLKPLTWSVHWNRYEITKLISFGFAPSREYVRLSNKEDSSNIIDRVSLIIAQVISFILYVLTIYIVVMLASDAVLIVITLISLIIWCIIKLLVEVIFKLFSSAADDDDNGDDEVSNNIEDDNGGEN